jgi:hypothetical protein
VAGAIGRGLAVELRVGIGDGLGVGIGDGVASPALLVTTVGIGVGIGDGVAVLEQATTASSGKKIEPIRARRPVRTLSSQIIYVAVAPLTPHPPLLLCGR